MEKNTLQSESLNRSSSRSGKKKNEILPTTIIASLERDINGLLQEITVRNQRNKLISMTGKKNLTRNVENSFKKIRK
jgi:hypothetical protein